MSRDRQRLEDILQAIDLVAQFTSSGEQAFRADPLIQAGTIHQLVIIGEAVKNLSVDLEARNADVPWRQISGMRDRLIHAYGHVDLTLVWSAVLHDLPPLRNRVKTMLSVDPLGVP